MRNLRNQYGQKVPMKNPFYMPARSRYLNEVQTIRPGLGGSFAPSSAGGVFGAFGANFSQPGRGGYRKPGSGVGQVKDSIYQQFGYTGKKDQGLG